MNLKGDSLALHLCLCSVLGREWDSACNDMTSRLFFKSCDRGDGAPVGWLGFLGLDVLLFVYIQMWRGSLLLLTEGLVVDSAIYCIPAGGWIDSMASL